MNARTNVPTSVWERTLPYALPMLLLVGFAVRLLFVRATGFSTDVNTFVAWTLSLLDNGLGNFYTPKTGFADYPPGYLYILALFGHLWAPFRGLDPQYDLLRIVVKLPAILADLGAGWLIYIIGRRFATPAIALSAAAVYILNPASIMNSAYWGQVDSVGAGFALLGAYLLLKSNDDEQGPWLIPAGWVSLAYSLLIKPQAAVLIVLFLAFAFADRARLRERLSATAIGIAAALVFTILLVLPFHPTVNPVEALRWLLERYAFGSSVYDYNSVNAFNLWSIRQAMWAKDSMLIWLFPQYVWGIVLVLAALGLVVWRYLQERTAAAFMESCTIALLAFYILSTRMHERYSFDALTFCIACIPIARRYLWGALALSVVLFADQIYALQYLQVVTNNTPGVDPHNLWGPLTSFYSLIAVGTFFGLGYVFLGTAPETTVTPSRAAAAKSKDEGVQDVGPAPRARDFFDPREGLSIMTMVDYVVMSALGVVSFVLSYIRYWYPKDKIFDEIYFARAAEEYLKNMRIYENTHPPLTKLLVTISVMLFGGLGHGDNSWGWRFGDVVFGALVVMLLYLFAKRVTGSTIFASIAAFFLLCDGMHFVQSRIGTPEGFVVVFSLGAVYAFYRFWIASQVESRPHTVVPGWGFAGAVLVSLAAGGLVVGIWDLIWKAVVHPAPALNLPVALDLPSSIVVVLYAALGVYLLLRYVLFRERFADGTQEFTFPEGSYALVADKNRVLYAPDGGSIETSGGKSRINMGEVSQNRSGVLVYPGDDYTFSYKADPSVTYETPVATATYVDNEIRAGDARERGRSATLWLVAFTIALGLLVSSKWYGVMGFGVSFIILILIWLQRYFAKNRPALWGNARGFRLDGALATILFVSATVYGLAWVPDLVRQSSDPNEIHNFNDVIGRQYSMFEYHDKLVAKHPYTSYWYQWPIDYIPIAYFYQDHRTNKTDNTACCIEEITSMPNPFIMWFGLLSVPIVGVLAWLRKNKAYALIVITYLLQWLPWMKSPRITFAYHFYVDIPLICLCNAIVLQQIWLHAKDRDGGGRTSAIVGISAVVALIAAAFIFFYPVLAAVPITWDQWHLRMWFPYWIVGPYG